MSQMIADSCPESKSDSASARAIVRAYPEEVKSIDPDFPDAVMLHRGERVQLLNPHGDGLPTGLTGTYRGHTRQKQSLFYLVEVDGLEDVARAAELYLCAPGREPVPDPTPPAMARRIADLQELASRYNRIALLAYDIGMSLNQAVLAEAAERRKLRALARCQAAGR